MSKPYGENCGNCRFNLGGLCGRRAPVGYVREYYASTSDEKTGIKSHYVVSEFPPQPNERWCGDYEKE